MTKAKQLINEINGPIPDDDYDEETKDILMKAANTIVRGIEDRKQTGPYKEEEREFLSTEYYIDLVNMVNDTAKKETRIYVNGDSYGTN